MFCSWAGQISAHGAHERAQTYSWLLVQVSFALARYITVRARHPASDSNGSSK